MSYRLSMFIHLLKKSDWAFLLDFVSPAFFKVIPPLELVSNASALAKRTQDKELYRRAIIAMREQISKTVPEIQLLQGQMSHGHSDVLGFNPDSATEEQRRALAQRIVEIYFAQIFLHQTVFLDLRLSRFSQSGMEWRWSPAPLLGVFSSDFLNSMAALYDGFYGNKPAKMHEALRKLGMEWAFDVFMEHFGEGDQTSVKFTMSHFVHTFHEIFMKCKAEKKNLKGEFVQLGVILGLMYESLERLNVPVDVRAAFNRVAKAVPGH
jgi:hypothetical protein